MLISGEKTTRAFPMSRRLNKCLPGDGFQVHEVAKPPTAADVLLVLPASSLPEVRHGGELGDDRPSPVKATIESGQCSQGLLFLNELDVNVANHVVRCVIANVQVLDLAILVHLLEDVFIEVLKRQHSDCERRSTRVKPKRLGNDVSVIKPYCFIC